MPRRMEQTRDLTDKKVTKTGQKSRKPSFTEMQYRTRENPSERQHRGNMSEAAQVSTPRSRELVSRDRRFEPTAQRWKANRGDSSVTSNPSESPRHGLQRQGNEVKSRPNEKKYPLSRLGQLKGGGPGESSKKPDGETSEQQGEPGRRLTLEELYVRYMVYDH